MLVITKEQIESYNSCYKIEIIDKLTLKYIAKTLVDIIDFSEEENALFEYSDGELILEECKYNKEEKIRTLESHVSITGYYVADQHPSDNLFIYISLNTIHSKYKTYQINYYTEPRTFEGDYDVIKDDLEKYLEFFNTEFNKILKEIYEQEKLEKSYE